MPWPEVLVDWPLAIARSLGPDMKTAQLRRFFTRVKAIESGLDAGDEFARARAGLMELQPLAAYAVGRKTAPELFKQFIERNVPLATKDIDSFKKGFVPHFQSLMAYFKYLYPRES